MTKRYVYAAVAVGLANLVVGSAAASGPAASTAPSWDSPPVTATVQGTIEGGLMRCANVSVTDAAGQPASFGSVQVFFQPDDSWSYGLVFHGGYKSCVGSAPTHGNQSSLPVEQTVTGYVDVNGDGIQGPGEPTFTGAA